MIRGRVRSIFQHGTNLNQNAWYGVERDVTNASPDWTRIASSPAAMDLHRTLPVHQLFRPCVINTDKSVNYYLQNDLTKKADGSASNLSGTDGNVMSYQTKSYWKFTEKVGTIERIKVSVNRQTEAGWVEITPQFYSVYEGKLVGTKLSSVSGVLPTTSRSEMQFRIDARANGAGYEQQWLKPYTELVHLFFIQFATNNFQKAVTPALTVEGYCQGGIGNGITTATGSEWSAFNGYNSFISSGTCNSLVNHWGETSVVIANFGGAGVNRTFTPNRFLFVENIFGHVWKWTDGVTINHLADRREVYVFDNPAQFTDNSSLNGRLAGLLPNDGYIKTTIFPEILPATIGGSSTSQYCDYVYNPVLGSGWKALLSGGYAHAGAFAGPLCASTYSGASVTYTYFGARLFAR